MAIHFLLMECSKSREFHESLNLSCQCCKYDPFRLMLNRKNLIWLIIYGWPLLSHNITNSLNLDYYHYW